MDGLEWSPVIGSDVVQRVEAGSDEWLVMSSVLLIGMTQG